eukprot:4275116-Prymnesium_polylepis.1
MIPGTRDAQAAVERDRARPMSHHVDLRARSTAWPSAGCAPSRLVARCSSPSARPCRCPSQRAQAAGAYPARSGAPRSHASRCT